MEQIVQVLLRILKFMQILIILASIASFIYLGIMAYFKKFDEVKKNLPWILIGLALLFAAYSIPVIVLSFLEIKEVPKLP